MKLWRTTKRRTMFLSLLMIFSFALMTSGCPGPEEDDDPSNVPRPPGYGALQVNNNTSYPIYGVYVSPSSSSSWGGNQIGSPISAGSSSTIVNIPTKDNPYDVMVDFTFTQGVKYGIKIPKNSTYVLNVNDSSSSGVEPELEEKALSGAAQEDLWSGDFWNFEPGAE